MTFDKEQLKALGLLALVILAIKDIPVGDFVGFLTNACGLQ